ncbi:hypothetical protein LCGC14_1241910 [marine sediment metagenome]|uniref:Uncharacterized protein n=1 Tax=marine sediment metagenome TaxID=412755 RepID=A0A0F9L9L3_9ZZZZ
MADDVMEVICGTCRYFDRLKDGDRGLCRIAPPQGVDCERAWVGAWPLVSPDDWCGQGVKTVVDGR